MTDDSTATAMPGTRTDGDSRALPALTKPSGTSTMAATTSPAASP